MTGEAAYFFTHLAGAVYFIETVDASRSRPMIFKLNFIIINLN